MRRAWWIVATVMAVAASGCPTDYRGRGPRPGDDPDKDQMQQPGDAGGGRTDGQIGPDGGEPPPEDPPLDASQPPPVDASRPPPDAAEPPPVDAGRPPPPPPTCRAFALDRIEGTQCEPATVMCVEACADGACISDCVTAGSADCNGCFNVNLIECWARSGCRAEVNCYAACRTDECPATGACPDSICAAETEALNTCAATDAVGAACGESWWRCVGH